MRSYINETEAIKTHLQQALTYRARQEWRLAAASCKQVLKVDSNIALAHQILGNSLQNLSQQDWAIESYLKAIALKPNSPEVFANLGKLYAKKGQWKKAIMAYEQCLALAPKFVSAYRCLAKIWERQGDSEKAWVYLFKALELEPKIMTVQQHIKMGNKLGYEGEQEKALFFYQCAIKLDPSCNISEFQAAKILLKLQQTIDKNGQATQTDQYLSRERDSAIADFEGSRFDPDKLSPQQYLDLGPKLLELELLDQAEVCCRQALKAEKFVAYLTLGKVLEAKQNFLAAEDCYQQLLKHDRDNLEALMGLALLKEQRGDRQAQDYYRRALETKSGSGESYHHLGDALSKREDWQGAVRAYQKAIKIDPDFSWSYNNLGYALIQLHKWSEAIGIYYQAIKLKPDFSWSYYNLAKAYEKLDQWSEAIASYEKAVQLQPDLPHVQQNLGNALYRRSQQDHQRALECCELAIAQDPDNTEAYHLALAIDNRNIDLYLQLGDIMANSGNSEQALIIYQMALGVQPKNTEVLTRIHEVNPSPERARQGTSDQYQSELNLPVVGVSHLEATVATAMNYEAMVAELETILPHSNTPTVSIVIPVYNQLDYTLRCLKAIAVNLDKSVEIEIILVDDCSTDYTAKVIEPLTAVNLVNQTTNQGFIHSCNLGASKARGEYIYFLNNDTEIQPNCIASLIEVFADEKVGAVGSKLLYPQGMLQEAGGIIWSDASGWNYGRQDHPSAPEYNYLREVDYCSGASLMVRKDVFDRLGGFERDFAPAYYEDTDLCFAIRHFLGLKVIYQPQSQVIHYEGISCGTDISKGVKRYQLINHHKFVSKWQFYLKQYPSNTGSDGVAAASRRYHGSKTILVIDIYAPCYDRESGARRIWQLLQIFKQLDYHVIFVPDNGAKEPPYIDQLQNLGIEILYTEPGYATKIEQQVAQLLPLVDIAWVCRPQLFTKYAPLIRQHRDIKLIYDTVDLHYLRLKRAGELNNNNNDINSMREWVRMQSKELQAAHEADLTITITDTELETLQEQQVDNLAVVPNIHSSYLGEKPRFNERQGLLFIGSYNHPPNVDAVSWLVKEIMPIVWQYIPELNITLLGSNVNESVMALELDPRVTITGYISDVTPYFLNHRVFVAPLRYGAGMKGKIGQSLEYGLPIISTAIGIEGMGLTHEQNVVEANQTAEFAQQIIRLYQDENLWNKLAASSNNAIAPFTAPTVKQKLESILTQLFN